MTLDSSNAVLADGEAFAGVEASVAKSISALSAQCVKDAKNDREGAIKLFITRIGRDRKLLDELLEQGARYFVRVQEWRSRADIVLRLSRIDDAKDVLAEAARLRIELVDTFVLPNGMILGDAKRENLGEAIEHYRKQSKQCNRRATFLNRIVPMIKIGKTVRQSVDNAVIVKLSKALN